MAEMIRGAFMSEQKKTAPPWSGGWLAAPKGTIEQRAGDKAFPTSHGGTAKGYTALGCDSPAFTGLDETRGEDFQTEQRKKKLFVGMAPKSAYEEDYKAVFAPFGNPVDIYVIRDRDGFSKGCAFIKYESIESAYSAIEALHDKYIMPGGFHTLVVTIADFRREPNPPSPRDAVGGGDSTCIMPMSSPCGGNRCKGSSWNPRCLSVPGTPFTASQSTCTVGATALQASVAVSGMPYIFYGGPPSPQGTFVYYPFICPSSSDLELSSKPHHGFTVGSGYGVAGRRDMNDNVWGGGLPAGAPVHCHVYAQGVPEDVSLWDTTNIHLSLVDTDGRRRRWAKQVVGPPGANLFVYYLPEYLSDAGLATTFARFGKVLSAKIYCDRDTLESKGFGFVSYADPDHADVAISRMNGFSIGQKRLKVVRKRGQQRTFYTNNTVNETKYGIPPSDGNGNGGSTSGSSGRSSDFGCGAFDFGWGSGGDHGGGGDAREQRDLQDEAASLDFDRVTPESLLGLSMTRFL